MEQFDEDKKFALSALTKLFSTEFSDNFDNVVYEGEFDGETILDDIQDEDDSNIITGLQITGSEQLKLFCDLMIQIFKYHNYNSDMNDEDIKSDEKSNHIDEINKHHKKEIYIQNYPLMQIQLINSWSMDANPQTCSDTDEDIEELYTTSNIASNNINILSTEQRNKKKTIQTNSYFNILDKIHNKRAWFNANDLNTEYASINPDIIASISLKDLNNNSFRYKYEYKKLTTLSHWLIIDKLLIGEDPTGFVDLLVKDNFTTYISLHEWKHSSYKDDIKVCCKNMGNIELIAFTINDFGTVDDKKTVKFIEELVQKIFTVNKENKIYMHCFGGHGRTGLISSLLLQAVYGMNSFVALKFLSEIHRVRHPYCGADRMPESRKQLKQIKRLQRKMIQIHNKIQSKSEIKCNKNNILCMPK